MTVKVEDESAVAGFLAPGAIVDVLAVINSPDGGFGQNPISKIILQNIKVLVGGQKQDQQKGARESSGAKSVTLLVTPEQAEKLVLSSVDGKLRLALRNSVDLGDELTPGANKNALLDRPGLKNASEATAAGNGEGAEKPRPPRSRARPVMASVAEPASAPPPPPARPKVEIYEGSKRKAIEFP
jgi:pilus assembly protein CpaB